VTNPAQTLAAGAVAPDHTGHSNPRPTPEFVAVVTATEARPQLNMTDLDVRARAIHPEMSERDASPRAAVPAKCGSFDCKLGSA
jgi:hypothetical protein